MKQVTPKELRISSLSPDGYGVSDDDSVFEWRTFNALAGETVSAECFKKRKGLRFGIATSITVASPDRIPPREPDHYLSCSPWQILNLSAEEKFKYEFASSLFLWMSPSLLSQSCITSSPEPYGYRNKMEYSFYGYDDDRLSLAFFQRMRKGKIPLIGCDLAMPGIQEAANIVLKALQSHRMSARSLKSLIIRSTQQGQIGAALFFKDRIETDRAQAILDNIDLPNITLFYSDHRCPASVPTELLCEKGSLVLSDTLLNKQLLYHTLGFFQVNLPLFASVLTDIQPWLTEEPVLDLYCGVGTISIALSNYIQKATLVESDPTNAGLIAQNLQLNDLATRFSAQHAASENSLKLITDNSTLILDPPRAGLHTALIERILVEQPRRIIYLACNPTTQARDCKLLAGAYTAKFFRLYNFFPHTPHIESLIILDRT